MTQTRRNGSRRRCQKVAPDVLFDCQTFETDGNGTLSCGNGLTSCQDGGFHLQFDRVRFREQTGFDTDTRIFVDSNAFKRVLQKDDCYKPD